MSERLTSKSGIRESLRNAVPAAGKVHSIRSYHRFFEGYVEEYIPKANGRGKKIVRTYIGKYYVPDQKNRKWIGTKLIYALLFILATAFFIVAATREIGFSRVGVSYLLTLIPQPLCVIFVLWCMVAIINLLITPHKMTIGEYKRSSESLKTGAKCYSLALVVAAAGELAQLFFCTAASVPTVILCAQGFLLASVLVLKIYRMERQRTYHEVSNPNAVKIQPE